MVKIHKYDNLHTTFPLLQEGLCNAIQTDSLEIKQVRQDHETTQQMCKYHPKIAEAYAVIFSPHMIRSRRDYETFIFIDKDGKIVDHISGREMQLYGILEQVDSLELNIQYKILHQSESA